MATNSQSLLERQLGTFDIGDAPKFKVTFHDEDGALDDPTAVVFTLRTPAGAETSFVHGTDDEVDRVSTGVFRFTAPTLSASGTYRLRAKGTEGLIAADEGSFTVRASRFTTP